MRESTLALSNWPFELFIHFTKFLSASDVLTLRRVNKPHFAIASHRSTWRALADSLAKVGPIPVHVADSLYALTTDQSSDLYALIRSLTAASRVHANWIHGSQPKLRKILVFQPNAQKRWVDIAALLPPESRYLVSTEYYEAEKLNKLTVSDIHLQAICGTWAFGPQQSVLTYRPVDNGAAIIFVIQPGSVRSDGFAEYELVRFEFSLNRDEPTGQFMSRGLFLQPRQISDVSLSEDLVLILDSEQDGTITLEVLNWRTGQQGRFRTGVQSPPETYNLNLFGPYLTLWIHAPSPYFYNYPMSLIALALSQGVDHPVTAPQTAPTHFRFEDSTPRFELERYSQIFTMRSRMWEGTKEHEMKVTDREMQGIQFWAPPVDEGGMVLDQPEQPVQINPMLVGTAHQVPAAPPPAEEEEQGGQNQNPQLGQAHPFHGPHPQPPHPPAPAPAVAQATQPNTTRLAIAYYRLPIPFSSTPITRTWLTDKPIDVIMIPAPSEAGMEQSGSLPLVDFNQRYGIWVEPVPPSHSPAAGGANGIGEETANGFAHPSQVGERKPKRQSRQIKLLTLPTPQEIAARHPPSYYTSRIKTFPIPSTFDMEDIQQLSMDEPSGMLGLTFSDGRLWLLYFDGYDDDRYNIKVDTLKIMFPNHPGGYSLNRLGSDDDMDDSSAGRLGAQMADSCRYISGDVEMMDS